MKAPGPGDPDTVGPYQVLAELGRGGMGRVWLGAAPDGALVAVKQVREQFVDDDGFRTRFRREVTASGKVSGAYTAAVVDSDPDAPTPWLASEYVPGPSLRDVLDDAGPLPADAALRLAAGLATALTEIHRAGLVHRDLKPSNVLVTADGPRVIDFGIARATDSAGGTEVTHTGWLVGAPGFMSPEQAEGRPVTGASDVFALGTVLIVACTGANPFDGPSTPQTLYNIVYAEPDLDVLPAAIRSIVERCLAKDPDARPTAADLVAQIDPVPPAEQPWPDAVRDIVARQAAEVDRLVAEARERTVLLGDAATALRHRTLVDPVSGPAIGADAPTSVVPAATPDSAPPSASLVESVSPTSGPHAASADAVAADSSGGAVSDGLSAGAAPEGLSADAVPDGPADSADGEVRRPAAGDADGEWQAPAGEVDGAWQAPPGAEAPPGGPVSGGGAPPFGPPVPVPAPRRGGRIGLIVAGVAIGLVVLCLGGTALVGQVLKSAGSSSAGSGHEVTAADEPTEEPSESYEPSPEESDSPSPSPTARDPETLDDESTDDLELDTDNFLPGYVDDYELAAASDDHSGCVDSGDDATQELMAKHGCGRMVTGEYLDNDNGLMASVMVIPLSTADDADAVRSALAGKSDAFTGLQFFCPHEGTGSSLCDSGPDARMWVFYPSYHRYLIVVTILRLDGGDTEDDSATDALGRGVIDGIEDRMLTL
ncbi:MAG TPA: protein kinase [Actinocatenispora sp.]